MFGIYLPVLRVLGISLDVRLLSFSDFRFSNSGFGGQFSRFGGSYSGNFIHRGPQNGTQHISRMMETPKKETPHVRKPDLVAPLQGAG